MNSIKSCVVPNCIPTPSSCVEWNGGDIKYLGICDGDSLNLLITEVLKKLQAIAGEDLSGFDIDSLLNICNLKAPSEVTLINILNLLKNNQVCLKDLLGKLEETLAEILNESKVNINLACYAQFDNLGNSLEITRDGLDQLVINQLCSHKESIETLNGKFTDLQEQINNIDRTKTVEELEIATCVDATVKPTSAQLVSVAEAHCDLETATGGPADIAGAMALTPSDWNTKFGTLVGWNPNPVNQAEWLGNIILILSNTEARVKFIEENCCAATCEDVKLGFSAIFNEDFTGIILKFTYGAGTVIPNGFTDKGSTGTVKDKNGNVETFNLTIANNYEVEIPIAGLDLTGDLSINISAKLGTDTLTCEKCLNKTVKPSGCGYCEITATGTGKAILVYEDESTTATNVGSIITTTSTTTTTTTIGS